MTGFTRKQAGPNRGWGERREGIGRIKEVKADIKWSTEVFARAVVALVEVGTYQTDP